MPFLPLDDQTTLETARADPVGSLHLRARESIDKKPIGGLPGRRRDNGRRSWLTTVHEIRGYVTSSGRPLGRERQPIMHYLIAQQCATRALDMGQVEDFLLEARPGRVGQYRLEN
jgi:hypothetical protein